MQKLLSLIRSHLFIFAFISNILGGGSQRILLWFMLESVLPMFSSGSFIVSGLMFRYLIHFELIFVYGVTKCSSFILLQVVDQWKRSVFIPIPKKDNVKECSNYHTIALISHASKVMLKILQARL